MARLAQTNVAAKLKTPLGNDVLVLTSFEAVEGLGELFEIHIDALSEQANIDFDKAIGRSCTVRLDAYKGKRRFFDGILTRAQWVEKIDDFFHYRLVLRPWFYLLGHKADCRIFLDKNVKDIIKEVFAKGGFTDFEFRTTTDYDHIPYCVQYRETDLAFCCRLMEQYGIYYFFEHADGKHTMVLADSRSSHRPNADVPSLPYLPLSGTELHEDQLLGARTIERRLRTGKSEFNDYDYLKPNKKLRAPHEGHETYAHSKLEVYDYPGKHDEESKGEKFAKFRLEAEQSFDHRRHVDGDAASLFPGSLVTVERHPIETENGSSWCCAPRTASEPSITAPAMAAAGPRSRFIMGITNSYRAIRLSICCPQHRSRASTASRPPRWSPRKARTARKSRPTSTATSGSSSTGTVSHRNPARSASHKPTPASNGADNSSRASAWKWSCNSSKAIPTGRW
jgi:type VI secretion system secreted protein VgrG